MESFVTLDTSHLPPISNIADEVAQALFTASLIAVVTFLIGVIGSYREIVDEREIYLHEKRKGLNLASYLAMKLSIYGFLYGLVAPSALMLVLNFSAGAAIPVADLLWGSATDVWMALSLIGLSSVALGLAISSISTSREVANQAMGLIIIAGAVFAFSAQNSTSWPKMVETISYFLPVRLGVDALQTTTGAYCLADIYETSINLQTNYHYSIAQLTYTFTALLLRGFAFVFVCYVALSNHEVWFSRQARLQKLINPRICIVLLLMVIQLGYTAKAHAFVQDANLLVTEMREAEATNPYLFSEEPEGFLANLSANSCNVVHQHLYEQAKREDELPHPFQPVSTSPPPPGSTMTTPTSESTAKIVGEIDTTEETPEPMMDESEFSGTPLFSTPPALELSEDTLSESSTEYPAALNFPYGYSVITTNVSSSAEMYAAPYANKRRIATVPAGSSIALLQKTANEQWVLVGYIDAADKFHAGWMETHGHIPAEDLLIVPVANRIVSRCATPVGNIETDASWSSDLNKEVSILVVFLYTMPGWSKEVNAIVSINGQLVGPINKLNGISGFTYLNTRVSVQFSDRVNLIINSQGNMADFLRYHATIYTIPEGCSSLWG